MKDLSIYTQEEKNLALYLEAIQIDSGCRIDAAALRNGEEEIIQKWERDGLLETGSVHPSQEHIRGRNRRVRFLTDELWELAHFERKARAERTAFPWDGSETDMEEGSDRGYRE